MLAIVRSVLILLPMYCEFNGTQAQHYHRQLLVALQRVQPAHGRTSAVLQLSPAVGIAPPADRRIQKSVKTSFALVATAIAQLRNLVSRHQALPECANATQRNATQCRSTTSSLPFRAVLRRHPDTFMVVSATTPRGINVDCVALLVLQANGRRHGMLMKK